MRCYFKDLNTILLELDCDNKYEIYEDEISIYKNYYTKIIEINIEYKLDTNYYLKVDNKYIEIDYDGIFDTHLFSSYNYDGKLGVLFLDKIYFTLWAPLKKKIELIIYKDNNEIIFNMTKENGVFKANIDLQYENNFYMYRIHNIDNTIDAIDPHAICVIKNKGYLFNLNNSKINLDYLKRNIKDNQRIIYETHIKDFTHQLNNQHKFIGLIEDNSNIGFNHIKELGITDVQLLPIFDYSANTDYDWGYMPLNYNSLTSIYSINEYNKIDEFKKVVNHYHKNNIGIIMDVVYNHTSINHSFDLFTKGYFYRKENNYYTNASGCGNEIASTRYMVRKYIIDSICFWATEYKLDGFRFDLMGILDVYTLNTIASKLKEINKEILIYGEPWSALNPNIGFDIQCNKTNMYKLNNVYAFNDTLRDAIKGNVFDKYDKGFIQGNNYCKNLILKEINKDTINYVSCHDNNTLYDKLSITGFSIAMQKQANAIILLSKGISFIHSGVEFCRTKHQIENSYNSDININKINWENKYVYNECFTYYKNLINFKKKLIITNIEEYDFYIESILSYKINNYIIIHNGNCINNLNFEHSYLLVFHNIECNITINNLYLEKNNTYIIKELV